MVILDRPTQTNMCVHTFYVCTVAVAMGIISPIRLGSVLQMLFPSAMHWRTLSLVLCALVPYRRHTHTAAKLYNIHASRDYSPPEYNIFLFMVLAHTHTHISIHVHLHAVCIGRNRIDGTLRTPYTTHTHTHTHNIQIHVASECIRELCMMVYACFYIYYI